MATPLDISLDDIIKKNRSNNQRTRGGGKPHRGRGAVNGPVGGRTAGTTVRRGHLTVNMQQSSKAIAKSSRRNKNLPWRHDLFEDSLRAVGISGQETGTKLYLSNLDYGVTNEDIRELFADIGELKRYNVHYDKDGRSSSTADVVYIRRNDALVAMKRYNNVQLDGKPMKIEIIGANPAVPVSARVNVSGGANGSVKRTVVMRGGRGASRGGRTAAVTRGSGKNTRGGLKNNNSTTRGRSAGARGRGAGGRGAGGRGGGKKPVEKSADELDKELETYTARQCSLK